MDNSCQRTSRLDLSELPAQHRADLKRAWQRADLQRYLKRWRDSDIPAAPLGFFAFEHRTVDVGCGVGRYILEQGARFPHRAFLGVDKGVRRSQVLMARIQEVACPNVFGVHTNATPFLCQMPDGILDEITIFYPNPWWPRKHRLKRWAYHPLLVKLCGLLKPGGHLLLCSNELDYLSEWLFAMENHPAAGNMVRDYVGPPRTRSGRTHFEVKLLREGHTCGEICFRRR